MNLLKDTFTFSERILEYLVLFIAQVQIANSLLLSINVHLSFVVYVAENRIRAYHAINL